MNVTWRGMGCGLFTGLLLFSGLAAATPPASLQAIAEQAASATLDEFKPAGLLSDQLALTVVDLRSPLAPVSAQVRGDVPIYPASVVKLFYLAAAHHWLETGRLRDSDELRRALRDMIVDSSNDATHYVVDLLTGTTSGPELPEPELKVWFDQRNAVNRYFAGLGYTGINANKKPWGDGPYGRESQAIRLLEPKRNMLTTDATARLLVEIMTGRCVTPARSAQMQALLARNPAAMGEEEQAEFTGPALPPGAKLWSKAGWTSQVRHDAAAIELPSGRRLVLVVFTTGHAKEKRILHAVARRVLAALD